VFYHLPAHSEYVLPAVGKDSTWRVTNAEVLGRFARRTGSTNCKSLDPDDGSGTRTQEVSQWSPRQTTGPAFLCSGLLGFPIKGGESARPSWKERSRDARYWWETGSGYDVKVIGSRDRKARNKPSGRLLEIGYRIERSGNGATLMPPASYPRDSGDSGQVYVRANGIDESAFAQFLRRLEYVRPADSRCRGRLD
jgi:hypothetical protein